MFEGISNTAKDQDVATVSTATTTIRTLEKVKPAQTEAKKNQAVAEKKDPQKVTQSFLEGLEQDIQMIHDVGLKFSVHNSTGRTMVKVVNRDTGDLIREVPPEEILNLASKIDEMIGILFDKTA